MNHSIFKDLLLNYIDGLTSEETNRLMQDHMNRCDSCRKLYEQMKDESLETGEGISDDSREFDAFKKVKKSNKKRIIWSILSTLFIASLAFGLYTYLYSTQWVTKSDDVIANVKMNGKTANINISAKNDNHFVSRSEEIYIKSKGIREYLIYEGRKGFNNSNTFSDTRISVTFVDENTIINDENEKETIDDNDYIVLKYKDKKVKMKIKDLYR